MEEPSVFDYLKALLTPWRGKPPAIPEHTVSEPPEVSVEKDIGTGKDYKKITSAEKPCSLSTFPWRILLLLLLVLTGQWMLEPPNRNTLISIIFYGISTILIIWTILCGELEIVTHKVDNPIINQPKVRFYPFIISLPLLLIAFLLFGENKFNLVNLIFWISALILIIVAFWNPYRVNAKDAFDRFFEFIKTKRVNIHIDSWKLLLIITGIFIFFFRFYALAQVPGEMFSDHAEKLLDVSDVLNGKTLIFFTRNTGREAFQMYLTALVALFFQSGLSFISLKIGTALAGFFTLPYIYLLGKEVANRWVGFSAMVFAGIAYWPNVISRVGLRFPLYPLFAAPALYYLVRGIRTSNINYYVLSGIALGLGLHGYSPFRLMPIIILFIVGVYLLHQKSNNRRWQAIRGLVILSFISFVVFLPLFRFILSNPETFNYRAFSRMGTTERSLPGSVWSIFFNNLWKAMIMFFWDNGNIWVHSIPGRPALDFISAGLFFTGCILLLYRYIRHRNWIDISILLLVSMLVMPSVLSLAFPDENPSLNRTGGAIIPVFIIIAIAFTSILNSLIKLSRTFLGKGLVIVLGLSLIGISSAQNFDLVFNQYHTQFLSAAWNTTTMGHFIRSFAESVGKPDSAYVVPYPHWVDTRLVGINAGYPTKDYAIWPENFIDTINQNGPKIFLLKTEDISSLTLLQKLYPRATYWIYYDKVKNGVRLTGKDFIVYFVPDLP